MKVRYRAMHPVDLDEVLEHLPLAVSTDMTGMIAYDTETAETVGAFVCQDWSPTSVQVHQYITRSMVLRHGFLEACADYIFTKAGRMKMYGLVPETNKNAISLNKKIGFTELVRMTDACDVGVDYVLMELKRENCPFWQPVKQVV